MIHPSCTHPYKCFVYGTLMSPHIVRTLLGRIPHWIQPAYLPPNYVRHPVQGQVYPGVVQLSIDRKEDDIDNDIDSAKKAGAGLAESSSSSLSWEEIQRTCLEGILLTDITPSEMNILDNYEGGDYTQHQVDISICDFHGDDNDGQKVVKTVQDVHMYLWTGGEDRLELDRSWSYEHFLTHHADTYFVD